MASKSPTIPDLLARIKKAVKAEYGDGPDGTHIQISGSANNPTVFIYIGVFDCLNVSLVQRMIKAVELQTIVTKAIGCNSLVGDASIVAGEFGATLRFNLKDQISLRTKPGGRRKRNSGEEERSPL